MPPVGDTNDRCPVAIEFSRPRKDYHQWLLVAHLGNRVATPQGPLSTQLSRSVGATGGEQFGADRAQHAPGLLTLAPPEGEHRNATDCSPSSVGIAHEDKGRGDHHRRAGAGERYVAVFDWRDPARLDARTGTFDDAPEAVDGASAEAAATFVERQLFVKLAETPWWI
jgi:hypothetical protein